MADAFIGIGIGINKTASDKLTSAYRVGGVFCINADSVFTSGISALRHRVKRDAVWFLISIYVFSRVVYTLYFIDLK